MWSALLLSLASAYFYAATDQISSAHTLHEPALILHSYFKRTKSGTQSEMMNFRATLQNIKLLRWLRINISASPQNSWLSICCPLTSRGLLKMFTEITLGSPLLQGSLTGSPLHNSRPSEHISNTAINFRCLIVSFHSHALKMDASHCLSLLPFTSL